MPLPNRSLLLQLFKLPCQSFSSIILEAALEKRESDTLAQRHHAPGAIMRHHYQSSLKLFDFNLFHIFLLFHLQWDDASNGAMVDKADALQYPLHNCVSTKGGGMMLIHTTDWYLRNLLFCAPVAGKSQAGSHEHWNTLHVCKYSCLMPNGHRQTNAI